IGTVERKRHGTGKKTVGATHVGHVSRTKFRKRAHEKHASHPRDFFIFLIITHRPTSPTYLQLKPR
uniref:Uncharacterized protein n=1 Tax=Aegilops tauschii subsp. strangulata TaxID=200361 RepID=A0A453ML61_AEGTS